MIHIVFNESEIDLMKQVFTLDETLTGEVIQLRDDYAVGPLSGIDTPEGWQARTDWWMELLQYSHYAADEIDPVDDPKTLADIKEKLDKSPGEELWIWMGQNQHDVCGYYRIIPELKMYQGRVMVLYMNNLPFINEKGHIFYPAWLNEIQPKEFLKAKKLARPVTLSEFEIDPDEWKRLCEENSMVRVLEGGKKIIGKDERFYDAEILKNLTTEWQKAWRLIGNTLHRMKIKTGDVFIEWRVKQLIKEGRIETTGDIQKGWKDFDMKLPGSKQESIGKEEEANY